MKHVVKLTMEDNVYHNIMFVLRNLKTKGLKIEEAKETPSTCDTKTMIKELLASQDIKVFKSIDNPMQWQKSQRDEWR
jgi:hypothetical protein